MTRLDVLGVTKSFRGRSGLVPVLSDVTFTLDGGEVAWLSGPSGAGKSTLLTILGLLSEPDSGQYRLDGRDLTHLPARARTELRAQVFSTIFQSGNLFAHLTALENVRIGLPSGHRRRARSALRASNVGAIERRRAGTLSGGEQQRVAVARAMARQSRVILADEPTASLDDANAVAVLNLLAAAAGEGAIVLIASHDPRVARISNRRRDIRDGEVI